MTEINAITVTEAAERLGVHPRKLQRVCQRHGVGKMVSRTMRLLTPRDIRQLPKLVAIDRRKTWRKEANQ